MINIHLDYSLEFKMYKKNVIISYIYHVLSFDCRISL